METGIWRIERGVPKRLSSAVMPSERDLEDLLAQDPALLGEALLVIGRQVHTPHGKFIDLLALDAEGTVHVLELKKDRTPRDVVAQLLDYGSWVSTLSRDDVVEIANAHLEAHFEEAFEDAFGVTPPDELNEDLRLTIIASRLDPSSERIVAYLRYFGVPVNAVFFTYLEDEDRRYLARTWLAAQEETSSASTSATTKRGKRADWNGRDWFVSFGEGDYAPGRSWEDGRRYGFVSAGGGVWYSRTLRNVPEGARVNVVIPKTGYVGVGIVSGPPQRFDQALVTVDGHEVRLKDQPLTGSYRYAATDAVETDDDAEWILPVTWLDTRPKERAFWCKGMFANQNSAGKLRQEYTLNLLAEEFQTSWTDEF